MKRFIRTAFATALTFAPLANIAIAGGPEKVIIRFKVHCQPGKSGPLVAAFQEVIAASRPLKGVVSFDIGRDLSDPDTFIATEVFEDNDALARQDALPEVSKTMGILGGVATETPEATIYEVSSSRPAM